MSYDCMTKLEKGITCSVKLHEQHGPNRAASGWPAIGARYRGKIVTGIHGGKLSTAKKIQVKWSEVIYFRNPSGGYMKEHQWKNIWYDTAVNIKYRCIQNYIYKKGNKQQQINLKNRAHFQNKINEKPEKVYSSCKHLSLVSELFSVFWQLRSEFKHNWL